MPRSLSPARYETVAALRLAVGGGLQRICDHLDEAGGGARGQDAVGAQAEGRRVGALKEGEALHHEDLQRRGGQGRAFG